MKSIQHVLWRGALALSLMAIGIGSGIGMPPAERADAATACPARSTDVEVAEARDAGQPPATLVVLRRRPFTPAG
jgi:hypothetical protein